MDAQTQLNAHPRRRQSSPDDATEAARGGRAARRRRRQRQSDGVRHDRGAVGRQQRHARNHREGIPEPRRRASNRTSICCPRTPATTRSRTPRLNLLALGEGKTGVFKIRQKELDADDYGQTILEETRKLNVGLGISVQQLVDGVQKETDASTWQARQEISFATMAMLGARRADAGRLGAVRLALCRPQYPAADRQPAALDAAAVDGDLETEIYQLHQRDEIAAMANSLHVFRESMIESRALSADQDKDRIAKAERASRMEARIVEFEATVRTALDSLQTSAGSMQTTAQSMSATADQSSALVSAVASAAEETSVNVQTVSSGTEELSSSIEEIGRQVVTSARNRPQGGRGSRRDRRHHAGAGRQRRAHQRGGRPDPDHRLADQSAGAQRHHRSRARRRGRPRIRRGRFRGQEPRQPDREGHRRNPPADRQHADGDDLSGRRHPGTSAARSARSTTSLPRSQPRSRSKVRRRARSRATSSMPPAAPARSPAISSASPAPRRKPEPPPARC